MKHLVILTATLIALAFVETTPAVVARLAREQAEADYKAAAADSDEICRRLKIYYDIVNDTLRLRKNLLRLEDAKLYQETSRLQRRNQNASAIRRYIAALKAAIKDDSERLRAARSHEAEALDLDQVEARIQVHNKRYPHFSIWDPAVITNESDPLEQINPKTRPVHRVGRQLLNRA